MEMGMGMARKMMNQTDDGDSGPMKKGMGMAKKMMGSESPAKEGGSEPNPMMQMCREMLGTIRKTTDMAAFATPELRQLFAEWLETLEDEALRHLEECGESDAAGLAKALNISQESTAYLIAHMTSSGKVNSKVRASGKSKKQ
ncbi:MAG TPA: MarR family transcriptional regulator [Rhizobiales bacterium]|nr:MarR family transcriptional regulator [Hyphomicrobiales bacterium]